MWALGAIELKRFSKATWTSLLAHEAIANDARMEFLLRQFLTFSGDAEAVPINVLKEK